MIIDGLNWRQFSSLPHIASMPLNRQIAEYEAYNQQIIAEQLFRQQQYNNANDVSAVGSGGRRIQQEGLPSGCIEFVNNTTEGTECQFWIETSAPTNYTITWGDGETTTGVTTTDGDGGIGDGDGENRLEIVYDYANSDTEYTTRICFDDISLVTYLNFNGTD
jgi:hypothetical protein